MDDRVCRACRDRVGAARRRTEASRLDGAEDDGVARESGAEDARDQRAEDEQSSAFRSYDADLRAHLDLCARGLEIVACAPGSRMIAAIASG